MAASTDDSVVLTGCGWVTPFAAGSIATVLAAAPSICHWNATDEGYWAVSEDVLADTPVLSKELKSNKGAGMTAVALEHARLEARLCPESVPPQRVGLVLGCALAGQIGMIDFADEVRDQTARFVSPIHFPQTVGNYIAGALARGYDIRGPNATIAGGVASGLDALIQACRLLRGDEADVVFAGGTDSVSRSLALGLNELDPGSPRFSEGACLFVLERAADAGTRAVAPLATVTNSGHAAGDDTVVARAPDSIVSTAGIRRSGAILIEHWVGRCFAALGAAAVAAAIGAATGAPVPRAADAQSVSIETIRCPTPTKAAIIADADGAHATTLELSVTSGT